MDYKIRRGEASNGVWKCRKIAPARPYPVRPLLPFRSAGGQGTIFPMGFASKAMGQVFQNNTLLTKLSTACIILHVFHAELLYR